MLQAARWWAEKSDAEDDERERAFALEQARILAANDRDGAGRSKDTTMKKRREKDMASPASRAKQTWEAQGAKIASTLANATAAGVNGNGHVVADVRR